MTVYARVDSPVGELLLVGERAGHGVALASVSMTGQRGAVVVRAEWVADSDAFATVIAQLRSYFAGESTEFDLELRAGGSDFQRRVWDVLDGIPYGTTASYGEVAAQAGLPRERVRAVAAAIGANPLLIVRPCHRVIGAGGALTGYAGGRERKQRLLELEGVLLAS
ncbi:methylated-DNA--[protein]-cysteine S-methyltransferase [Nocardia sp. NPDC050710]|uniref:methylated-DNA--[protein]-cysteine S-methyltransferase n=1 Tax=Nocardia sp. NPDC050710 TaxID=3157220 RepID=UPI0033F95D5F